MSNGGRRQGVALVIVGMCGSGKSTVASYLQAHLWPVVRFGDITMQVLERHGRPIDEMNERSVREALREEHGMAAFAILSLPAIEAAIAREGRVAIDGLYSWSELKVLKQRLSSQLIVVAVFTPRGERYRRLGLRPVRPLTLKEAESRDVAEIEMLEKGGPISFADHTLFNTGSVKDLEGALHAVLESEGAWRE